MPGHASVMSARLHAEHPEDPGRDLMLSYWPNSIQLIQIFCVIILGVRVAGKWTSSLSQQFGFQQHMYKF